MSGMVEATASALGIPAKRVELPTGILEELRELEFSTVLGLLHYGLTGQPLEKNYTNENGGLVGALTKMFTR